MNSGASPTVRSAPRSAAVRALEAEAEAALQKLEAIADELKHFRNQIRLIIEARSGGPRNA
jgi:predicted  nucleic acid-binding Zn-ribbon protein